MKKYILFDWDGNLARTLDVWLEAHRIIFKRRGLDLSDTEIASCFGVPRERFAELGIDDIDDAITEMDKVAIKLLPEAELYPDAEFVLEQLKDAGHNTALVTTSLRSNIIGLLDKYNMHRHFDVVIANEDTEKHKPLAEPIEVALQRLGGTKHEAIMIGDTDKDIGAAVNAGVESILFYPPEHEKFYSLEKLCATYQPTHTIDDFRKVLNIVKGDSL